MLKIAAPPRTVQAVILMICASATISVLWALLRWGAETMHPIYMVFWRSLFGAIVLAPLIAKRRDLLTVAGAGLILCSTVYIARRETGTAAAKPVPAE